MVEIIQAIILSIIQGITEWFPISSSGHLALIQHLFGFQNLSYDVFLHFASIFAVIFVFKKEIIKIFNLKNKENWRYFSYLLIALIPAIIVGFVFKDTIENLFSNTIYLGIFFIFSGIIIYSTKFAKQKKEKPNLFDSLIIGIFQAIAIFPGISRSGMTISSGLFRGISKEQAIKFSFFLAIPIILGASILELNNITEVNYFVLLISFIITLLVSIITIKLLIKIIKSDKFYLFGIYNILLGIIILSWTSLM